MYISFYYKHINIGDCMFYKYEIKNRNGEDVLYLYITSKYEFSNELINDEDNLAILSKNYIDTYNIPFKGNTIYLVIDDIITKSIDIKNNKSLSNTYFLPDNFLINIKLEDGALCEITLRDYLFNALFSNYFYNIGDETLKSICILYNTFCFKMMLEDKFINLDSSFIVYKDAEEYRDVYKDFDLIKNRFNKIIDDCSGIYLSYNGSYILPFMHYSNSGRTLNNSKYPYLTGVKSLWDLTCSNYINLFNYSFTELNKLLGTSIDGNSNVNIKFKNNGKTISIGDKSFSIYELKDRLKLVSNDISVIIYKDSICFICKGCGNSYGLSIYGAYCIENNGGKYFNILGYYFPKCRLSQHIKRLS